MNYDTKSYKVVPEGVVVIDPENDEHVDRLIDVVSRHGYTITFGGDMQAALREYANPKRGITERAPLTELLADGRQYFVSPVLRKDFLTASPMRRLSLAELVIENGRVIKNRNGVA